MTRVQIFRRVCPPGFDKPLPLGAVVEIDDEIAARYIKAEYALETSDPVTQQANVATAEPNAARKVRVALALDIAGIEALNAAQGKANSAKLEINGETYPAGALAVGSYDNGVIVLVPADAGAKRTPFTFLQPATAPTVAPPIEESIT